jgi:hypothetical protein
MLVGGSKRAYVLVSWTFTLFLITFRDGSVRPVVQVKEGFTPELEANAKTFNSAGMWVTDVSMESFSYKFLLISSSNLFFSLGAYFEYWRYSIIFWRSYSKNTLLTSSLPQISFIFMMIFFI